MLMLFLILMLNLILIQILMQTLHFEKCVLFFKLFCTYVCCQIKIFCKNVIFFEKTLAFFSEMWYDIKAFEFRTDDFCLFEV